MTLRPVVLLGALTAVVFAACAGSGGSASPPRATASAGDSPMVTTASPGPSTVPSASALGDFRGEVEIGDGRALFVLCRGTAEAGAPTVVFESGLSADSRVWDKVQRAVADRTRACAYDRAGTGASLGAPGLERTAADLTDDLEALLDAVPIPGPYVFVSHSLGPWVTSLFVARHPDRLAGLVLVDPRWPEVTGEHIAALPFQAPNEPTVLTEVRAFLAYPETGLDANREHLVYATSETETFAELDDATPLFEDRPTIVLRAERTLEEFPDLPPDLRAAWWQIWLDGQQRYADESTEGRVESLPGVGHDVPQEAPDLVIEAINEVLDAVAAE